jgi:hypothetical protein
MWPDIKHLPRIKLPQVKLSRFTLSVERPLSFLSAQSWNSAFGPIESMLLTRDCRRCASTLRAEERRKKSEGWHGPG